LFILYDQLCQCDLYHLDIRYETLFASSLAVKYHVWKLANESMEDMVSFCQIYDFGGTESDQSRSLVSSLMIDLFQGIFCSEKEVFIQQDLPYAVIQNKNNHNAHHDIILPTNQGGGIPISAKASVSLADRQLFLSKNSIEAAKMLIWLYFRSRNTELKYQNVAFINGIGACNGLALDIFILVKKLKSLNNQ
jgi:hypothetical protein